jgi:hypothetical protein
MVQLKKDIQIKIKPFLWIALIWLGFGQILCQTMSQDRIQSLASAQWMFIIWALSLLNLGVLAQWMSIVIRWMSSSQEKRSAYLIQTLFWGVFKLVCLGFFIAILLKGHHIPILGLLLGIGTLGVVPLLGGFFWSQRMLNHA